MAMHQFKAESKKLLDLMINSIYTNREIFLRELISNASDACDKRYFKSLTDTTIGINKEDLKIHLTVDKDSRTLTVSDNGIGMTKDELEKNLGTIAKSGSLDFKTENQSDNIDIIGQFGVGFYSAFMVAQKVTVISRAQGEAQAWKWESAGVEGYTLSEACEEPLQNYYARRQAADARTAGNGRLARNVIESAILAQAKRVLREEGARLDLLKREDFDLFETPEDNV